MENTECSTDVECNLGYFRAFCLRINYPIGITPADLFGQMVERSR